MSGPRYRSATLSNTHTHTSVSDIHTFISAGNAKYLCHWFIMLNDVWMTYKGLWFSPSASFRIKLVSFIVPSPENVLGLTRENWHWYGSVLNRSSSVSSLISSTNYPWCFIHSEALRVFDFTQQLVAISTKVDHSVRRSKLSTNMTILIYCSGWVSSADLPLWTQQDSLSRGDGGDPDWGSTFFQLNIPSWRSTE